MTTHTTITRTPLQIELSRRLPDAARLRDVPPDLDWYGRCAVLRDGSFWVGSYQSSHPFTTAAGFYIGLSDRTLYVSPRGCTAGWQKDLLPGLLEYVVTYLKLSGKTTARAIR